MINVTAADWEKMEDLARRSGLGGERVTLLRRRVESARQRPGGRTILLVGRPKAGIEQLLRQWISPAAATALETAGDGLVLIGASAEMEALKEKLGDQPTIVTEGKPGRVIAVRAAKDHIPAHVATRLATLGYVDGVVLVTRLSQPFHQDEKALARSLAGLGATAKALIVAVAGLEPTAEDITELRQFGSVQLQQSGYRDGRCLGAEVWFAGGNAPAGTLTDIDAFLRLRGSDVEVGAGAVLRRAVADLARDGIKQASEAQQAQAMPQIPEEDKERLTQELATYLQSLGREVQRYLVKTPQTTPEQLRTYAKDAFYGMTAGTTVEGIWLRYVERVRPGTEKAFLAETERAVADLGRDQMPAVTPATTDDAEATAPAQSVELAVAYPLKRVGIGLACGLVPWGMLTALHVGQVLTMPVLALGAIGGYAISRFILRPPGRTAQASPDPRQSKATAALVPEVQGWAQVERRMLAWFRGHIETKNTSLAAEWRELTGRLGMKELES